MNDEIRDIIRGMIDFEVEFTVSGYKSSEGDGRTAADIEKELSEARLTGIETEEPDGS